MKNKLIILLRFITLIPFLPIFLVVGMVLSFGAVFEFIWKAAIWLSDKFDESWVADALHKYIDFFEKRLK